MDRRIYKVKGLKLYSSSSSHIKLSFITSWLDGSQKKSRRVFHPLHPITKLIFDFSADQMLVFVYTVDQLFVVCSFIRAWLVRLMFSNKQFITNQCACIVFVWFKRGLSCLVYVMLVKQIMKLHCHHLMVRNRTLSEM